MIGVGMHIWKFGTKIKTARLDATTTRLTGVEYDRDAEELSSGAAGRSTSSTTTTTEA
ncbi:hypothetical protein DY000_02024942 [Brassica cretica]|uniref:Uncharacterized protein n=1 Tax=Brassica cretica TaxID=69181 RepID=A0ABQ7EE51_BRACR|nr:hypothetical protein DY000_02024942 [Brassica cretica]